MSTTFFFQTFPFYNPNPAAFFMSRVLCVSQQQSSIHEEIIQGRDINPIHPSNFVQDWISNSCNFLPCSDFWWRQCHSLRCLITYFCWKFYLPSSRTSCLQTLRKSSAGRPGSSQAFQGCLLGLSAVSWLLHGATVLLCVNVHTLAESLIYSLKVSLPSESPEYVMKCPVYQNSSLQI